MCKNLAQVFCAFVGVVSDVFYPLTEMNKDWTYSLHFTPTFYIHTLTIPNNNYQITISSNFLLSSIKKILPQQLFIVHNFFKPFQTPRFYDYKHRNSTFTFLYSGYSWAWKINSNIILLLQSKINQAVILFITF